MQAHVASAIHAFTLLGVGVIGYVVTKSNTAMIPVVFGVVLLVCNNGIRFEHKIMSHLAVVLTLLVTVALLKPFSAAMGDGDTWGMVRVGAMIVTGIIAMIAFVRSFIAAKKARTKK